MSARLFHSESLARRLAAAPPLVFVAVAGVFAFLAYCCVYAFRKPFTAGTFGGLTLWGIQFKIVLVTAQVAGYALSKFIGIRVISAMPAGRRARVLLGMVAVAGGSLLGFALTPFPWNAGWMLVNGLPLGMTWGLIFSYLEGRRSTEALAALLCANFIVSSGFVKTVGRWMLLTQGIGEQWMPFAVALLFTPLLLACVVVLEHLPPPSAADRDARAPRPRMDAAARATLFRRYAPGLLLLTGVYLLLTVVRDVRDNFAVELWSELGYGTQASILTTAEVPVAVFSLLAVCALMFVRDNFRALWFNHGFSILGALVLAGSTWLFQQQLISPITWMIASGFGLFLPYILFNGVIFDRLLAGFRERGNVGFLMYIADAVGYLGSVVVLLWKNFGTPEVQWLPFYLRLCYLGAGLVVLCASASWWYFWVKRGKQYLPRPFNAVKLSN